MDMGFFADKSRLSLWILLNPRLPAATTSRLELICWDVVVSSRTLSLPLGSPSTADTAAASTSARRCILIAPHIDFTPYLLHSHLWLFCCHLEGPFGNLSPSLTCTAWKNKGVNTHRSNLTHEGCKLVDKGHMPPFSISWVIHSEAQSTLLESPRRQQ